MTKKCIYCTDEIPTESVVDFCSTCGKNVWGEKMFNTIIQNMEDARERGDLTHMKPIIEPRVDIDDFEVKRFF